MYECNDGEITPDESLSEPSSYNHVQSIKKQGDAQAARRAERGFNYEGVAQNTGTGSSKLTQNRITLGRAEDYVRETTENEKKLIEHELCSVLLRLIQSGRAAYLDRLGIFFPALGEKTTTRIVEGQGVIRKEVSRNPAFEKCLDLTSYHRREYPQIAESPEIATQVYARLPLNLQVRWSAKALRKMLEGLIRLVKYEIVNSGSSFRLTHLGDFYCLHNRQGLNFNDWFAGSDILFEARVSDIISVGPARFFERPVFFNAWEPLESAFGEPISTFTIDLTRELPRLGYSLSEKEPPHPSIKEGIRVAVFKRTSTKDRDGSFSLLFCSDGLRSIGLNKQTENACGSEVTFQLSSISVNDPQSLLEELSTWSKRAFVLAWILLIGKRSGKLTLGSGLSAGCSLLEGQKNSNLSAIFTTPFSFLPGEQLSKEGAFYYNNLVGITEDEAQLAKTHSLEHLYVLLKHKNLGDVTNPSRASILNRTELFVQ